MDKLKMRLENTGLVLSIMTKISLFLGGLIFLFYCSSSGAFPENLSLGDGLWLILIISVFAVGMGTVYFFLGCLGVSIWTITYYIFVKSGGRGRFLIARKWLRDLKVKKAIRKNPVFFRSYKRDKPFVYNLRFPRVIITFHLMSFFTLVIMLGAIRENHLDWYLRLISTSIFVGLIFLILHTNKQKYLQIEHIVAREEESRRLKGEIKFANIITVAMLIYTTIYIGIIKIATNKTMIALSIRSENVTVFVKNPWGAVLDRHMVNIGENIKLNNDVVNKDVVPGYRKYDNMTVSLFNLGSYTFLEFNVENKSYSLKIPSSDIIVDSVPIPKI